MARQGALLARPEIHLEDSSHRRLALAVSFHSDDFAAAQDAQRALAATAALCGAARHAAVDAEERLAGIDPGLPGLLTTAEL